MKLRINQLGPIQKPSVIDLDKRFTVFVGENGSGKTYLSTALWEWRYDSEWAEGRGDGLWIVQTPAVQQLFMTRAEDWSRRLKEEEEVSFSIPVEEIRQLMREVLEGLVRLNPYKIHEQAKLEVAEWEGAYLTELSINVRSTFGERTVYTFTKARKDSAMLVRKEKPLSMVREPDAPYGVDVRKDKRTRSTLNIEAHFEGDTPQDKQMEEHLLGSILQQLFALVFPTAFRQDRFTVFLPTSHTTLLSMWKYLVVTDRREHNQLLDSLKREQNLSRNALQERSPDYSDPTAQWIDLVLQLEDIDDPTDHYTDLVRELESIMNGAIVYKRTLNGLGRKKYYYQRTGTDEYLPLHRAASSVNQLALLYLYLKYLATPGDNTLFIDEPEMNLHPENQVRLVNLLMRFANDGENCVYLTTHSSLVAETINNHILIGRLQQGGERERAWLKEHLPQYDLDINEKLSYKDFAVYHFADGGIEEYQIAKYGVSFKDFNQVLSEVDDVGHLLMDRIMLPQD